MPQYKAVPQILGLQRTPSRKTSKARRARGATRSKGAHRAASPRGILCEAAPKERASKSETLDPTRTPLNYAEGPESGVELWREMEEAAANHVDTYVSKDGTEHVRHARADAVIGAAVIHKLPAEATRGLDPETAVAVQLRFADDSNDVMNDIMEAMGRPRVFGGANRRAIYVHLDEGLEAPTEVGGRELVLPTGIPGVHDHEVDDMIDPATGRYCGNVLDSAFFTRLNREYPARMRDKGWHALEDLDVTDWDRYNEDPAYRAERDRAREGHGLPTNEYRARQRLGETLGELDEAKAKADRVTADARAEAERVLGQADDDHAAIVAEAEKAAARTRDEAKSKADRYYAAVVDDVTGRMRAALGQAHQVADGIELTAHHVAAGEEEAARQASDAAFDQLDAMAELREANARMAADLARAQQVVAHREDEERRAREAEAARARSEGAKAKADSEAARALAAKRRADADATKARDDAKASEARRGAIDADIEAKAALSKDLDAGIARKRGASSSLDAEISRKREDIEGLDGDISRKQRDLDGLSALYDAGNEELEAQREELRQAEGALAASRRDLEVATRRGPIKLSEVVSKVIDVCADALDTLSPRAAQWLRDRADDLREHAIDVIAPETRARELADYDEPEDAASDCQMEASR